MDKELEDRLNKSFNELIKKYEMDLDNVKNELYTRMAEEQSENLEPSKVKKYFTHKDMLYNIIAYVKKTFNRFKFK